MATQWEAPLDPGDLLDFYADFSKDPNGDEPVLAAGEKIVSFTAAADADASALGLALGAGQYASAIVWSDVALRIWLTITPAFRDNPDFCYGVPMNVDTQVVTDSVPPRTIDRSFTVIVKHV